MSRLLSAALRAAVGLMLLASLLWLAACGGGGDDEPATVYTTSVAGPVDVSNPTAVARIELPAMPRDGRVVVTVTFTVALAPVADLPQRAWVDYYLDSYVGGIGAVGSTPVLTDTTPQSFARTVTATFDTFAGTPSWVRFVADGAGKVGTATVSALHMRAEVLAR